MKWRNFIVWDKQQRDLLKRYCLEANYQVVGSMDFLDSSTIFKANRSGHKISVFDATTTKSAFYTSFELAIESYWS